MLRTPPKFIKNEEKISLKKSPKQDLKKQNSEHHLIGKKSINPEARLAVKPNSIFNQIFVSELPLVKKIAEKHTAPTIIWGGGKGQKNYQ